MSNVFKSCIISSDYHRSYFMGGVKIEYKRPIVVIYVAIIVLAAVILSVVVIADHEERENGLDGKYFYVANGTFEDDTIEYTTLIGYNGHWEIELNGGDVTNQSRTLDTTGNTLYTDIEETPDPVYRYTGDYAGLMSEKNGLIKGSEYIGDTTIYSTYYGELNTSVFVNGSTTYYVGDNGVVYRAIFHYDDLANEEVFVTYELISVIGDI